MAFIRIATPPQLTAEIYDAVNAKAGFDSDPPAGLLVHCASEVDGAFQVVDVWESEEDARRFDSERLGPAINAVVFGGDPTQSPDRAEAAPPVLYELHNLVVR
jgi:hypothetical protein